MVTNRAINSLNDNVIAQVREISQFLFFFLFKKKQNRVTENAGNIKKIVPNVFMEDDLPSKK